MDFLNISSTRLRKNEKEVESDNLRSTSKTWSYTVLHEPRTDGRTDNLGQRVDRSVRSAIDDVRALARARPLPSRIPSRPRPRYVAAAAADAAAARSLARSFSFLFNSLQSNSVFSRRPREKRQLAHVFELTASERDHLTPTPTHRDADERKCTLHLRQSTSTPTTLTAFNFKTSAATAVAAHLTLGRLPKANV